VPFDLWLSRAPSFEALRGGPGTTDASASTSAPPSPGFFARLFAKPAPRTHPISVAELHSLMKSAPATLEGEALYWVRHAEGDPWFAVEWKPEGHLRLSTSTTHHHFLRNLGDMFDYGLRVAGAMEARLFESVGGSEVTAENIDELLDPKGSYLAERASAWRAAIETLDTRVRAALEYPLDAADSADEFLLFQVIPKQTPSVESVRAALERDLPDARIEIVKDVAMHLVGADDEKALAKILRLPDGDWQVWPSPGQAAFARVASAVVGAAECIHREVGGELHFRGRPFDEATRSEVRSRMGGLAVEFLAWTEASGKDA
jgi:hypothetical protein